MMPRRIVWCALLSVCAACSSAPETADPELELITPRPQGSAELFTEAERMIAAGDREGAERACRLSRDALKKEALSEGEATAANARTAFCFAEIERLEWEAMPMDADSLDDFEEQMSSKIEGAKSVAHRYNEVIPMKHPGWTLAAITRLGDIHVHIAQTVEAVSTPTGFDKRSSQLYRGQLEEAALPLYQKASEHYTFVVEKADELELETPYVRHARAMRRTYPRVGSSLEDVL